LRSWGCNSFSKLFFEVRISNIDVIEVRLLLWGMLRIQEIVEIGKKSPVQFSFKNAGQCARKAVGNAVAPFGLRGIHVGLGDGIH
jgi:hypothetical protein